MDQILNKSKNRYDIGIGAGYCATPETHYAYFVKANKNDENIEIYSKYYILTEVSTKEQEQKAEEDEDYESPTNIKLTKDGKDIIVEFDQELDSIEKIKTAYDKYFDTYKLTFKKASDGNYYIYSSENLNDAEDYN